jgi:uncharacterized membrane protein YoaK (UPF0700 family)
MTDYKSSGVSLWWHIGNGALVTLIVAVSASVVMFTIGIVTGQPYLIGHKLAMPFLGIACCFSAVLVSKRVAKRLSSSSSASKPFQFSTGFHIGNMILVLVLMLVLLLIPVIGIPNLNPNESLVFPLLLSSMAVIFVFVQVVASVRAAKFITKAGKKEADKLARHLNQ